MEALSGGVKFLAGPTHSTPLECKNAPVFFYRHIAPLEQRDFSTSKAFSRQRRDISIDIGMPKTQQVSEESAMS